VSHIKIFVYRTVRIIFGLMWKKRIVKLQTLCLIWC